jgi:hypothetical protein
MKRGIIWLVGMLSLLATVFTGLLVRGDGPVRQVSVTPSCRDAAEDRLVVHEWGTFSSYSGSDGVRLEFRPLFDSDLPGFVLDPMTQAGNVLTKLSYRAYVRMETPVTYFYTQRPRDVQVRVGFPEGLLTEFYPPVAECLPAFDSQTDPLSVKNSVLNWGMIRLLPPSLFRPALDDEKLADVIQQRAISGLLPPTGHDDHYGYARETDSAIVHIHRPENAEQPFAPSGDFFEKFLFYRGLGNFRLPIEARANGHDRFVVVNRGADDISWMMMLEVEADTVRYTVSQGLPAGKHQELTLPPSPNTREALLADLVEALVASGLYHKEAESMAQTWQSSWFGEQGTRLLYLVPPRLTDEMLPLEIEPRPDELVRTLVGRLDVMTPEDEAAVTQLVRLSAQAREAGRSQAQLEERDFIYSIPEEIRQLGRLAEPALARISHIGPDEIVQYEARLLLDQIKAELGQTN